MNVAIIAEVELFPIIFLYSALKYTSLEMIATFIEQEEDISELERIEELIRKRMKELEEAQ